MSRRASILVLLALCPTWMVLTRAADTLYQGFTPIFVETGACGVIAAVLLWTIRRQTRAVWARLLLWLPIVTITATALVALLLLFGSARLEVAILLASAGRHDAAAVELSGYESEYGRALPLGGTWRANSHGLTWDLRERGYAELAYYAIRDREYERAARLYAEGARIAARNGHASLADKMLEAAKIVAGE